MRTIFILVTLLLAACGGTQKLKSEKAGSSLEVCMDLYRDENLIEALECLANIPDSDKNTTFYDLTGSIYQKKEDYLRAADAFREAVRKDTTGKNTFLYFKLGESYWENHQYTKAGESFSQFDKMVENPHPEIRKKLEYYLRSFKTAEELYKNPRSYDLVLLPEEINSSDQELGVSMTYDRRTMVFTRRDHQEDLFITTKKENEWQQARPMDALNTPMNEGAAAISGDGQSLVFTACNRPDGAGSCDLFYSRLSDTGWTKPVPLTEVNSRHWDSQPTLSPDGRALIFSSERPGGFGGRDLWLTVLDQNDHWIRPINLGPEINSPGNEENPFLHTDEQTLYFTSDFWPGLGGRDIFMAHREKGNLWSPPRNLGYPINSSEDESGVIVTSAGDTGIISSARGGRFDLYSFALDPEIRPQKAFLYRLFVLNEETDEPVANARVRISDQEKKEIIRSAVTDADGQVSFLMKENKAYGITVSHEDFGLDSYRVLPQPGLTDDVTEHRYVQPIYRNKSIILENVLFETGKSDLRAEARFELDQLAEFLNKNPAISIRLTGHTDNVGKSEDNLALSKNRAEAVREYLINRGTDPGRIEAEGKGDTEPIASNEDAEGRQKNRRTEMTIQ